MPNVDTGSFFGSPILQSFYKVCLAIDFVIYNLISWLYTVFITIAKARLFTSETIKPFIDRIYLIIGVGALFFAAYTFLTIIANPDNLTKGNSSPTKAIRNIILAIIAITFIPTIFNFAYSVQSSIVDNNVIGRVFMTRDEQLMDDSEQNLMEFGVTMFEASFYVKNDDGSDAAQAVKSCYAEARKNVLLYNDVSYYGACVDGVATRHIQYNFILAGIMGIIIVYVFFTYCFDIGLRAIKLTFLQIISPVPCLLLMVPGQDKMFKTWLKDTLKTFFEVFLKIFLVVFCVYMIQLLRQWFDTSDSIIFSGVSIAVINFAKLFLFLGVVMFMKKAPKLIEDAIGIKMDPKGLSLKQRLQDSGIAGFVDKTAGMVGGVIAANKAYNEGIAAGNKGNAFKRTLANFHGLRNGFNGGIKNIGKAYDYEMETQRSYALDRNKPMGQQIKNATFDALRDNFGFQSRYGDEVRRREIRRDALLADAYRDAREIEARTSDLSRGIDDTYKGTINAYKNVKDKSSAYNTAVDDEVGKETNKTRISNKQMYINKLRELKDDNADITNQLNDTTISADKRAELQRKLNQNNKEFQYLEVARKHFFATGSADNDFNNFDLNKEMERISKLDDSVMSREIKNALNYLYNEGKDQNKVAYLKGDDVTSSIKMAQQELELSLRDNFIGKGHEFNDGESVDIEVKNLREMYENAINSGDYKKVLKLKKESGILLDGEQMAKNRALSETPVTISINGEGPRQYTLYDLQRISSQLHDKIETLNKEVEKFIEARKFEERGAEIRRKRNDNRPIHKASSNNGKRQ